MDSKTRDNCDQTKSHDLGHIIKNLEQSRDDLDQIGCAIAAAHVDMAINNLIEVANVDGQILQ
jgi:hypothetical protein